MKFCLEISTLTSQLRIEKKYETKCWKLNEFAFLKHKLFLHNYDFFHRMKNVVIKNLYAVGMHHYGGKELPIETPMFCFPEPNNRWDPKAVAIFHDRVKANKAAYIRRVDAAVVFKKMLKMVFWYLKDKGPVEKHTKKSGALQRINIGLPYDVKTFWPPPMQIDVLSKLT